VRQIIAPVDANEGLNMRIPVDTVVLIRAVVIRRIGGISSQDTGSQSETSDAD
jgi:hypothetical protein